MLLYLRTMLFLTIFCSNLCINTASLEKDREQSKFHDRSSSSWIAGFKEKQPWCSISDAYDGGNIEYVGSNETTAPYAIRIYLRIKSDPFTQLENKYHRQYFSFRCICQTPNNTAAQLIFEILNAKDCSFPKYNRFCFYRPAVRLDSCIFYAV